MAGNNRRQHLVPQASQALEQLKQEAATEVGIANYQQGYRGDLPSRVNGSVGGQMVKRMIAFAETQIGTTGTGTIR